MRVLLISSHGNDPAYGGAERYVRDLAAGMSIRGHRVATLSAFPQESHVEGLETLTLHGSDWRDDRVRRLRNRIGDLIAAPWPRLGSVLDALQPDLVHTNNLPGIGTGIWESAGRRGIPVVHTLHDYYLLCPRTSLVRRDGSPCSPSPYICGARSARLARWSPAVDRLIAGSRYLLNAHGGLFSRTPANVIRLPVKSMHQGAVKAPTELLKLGYLGALTATKGVEVLLDAAPALARAGIRVRIAGDGPLRKRVEAADVDFAGRLEGAAVERFTIECDAGIVPSTWEEPSGPPYTVCEWIAAGRPVLASRRGGLAEADRMPGVSGFEPTATDLVRATVALREGERWQEVVRAIPPIADDRDVERWLDEHETVYGSAAGGELEPTS